MKHLIAIVNSDSFGTYTNVIDRLSKVGEVVRLNLPKNISGKELASRLQDFSFIVASTTPRYDSEFFKENKKVILIARNGIGLDNIDLNAATENGVVVTNIPNFIEREAVAELAVALILDAYRFVSESYLAVRENRWRDRGTFVGFELRGKTVGIIGLGNIGRRVAEILLKGFGVKILAYDPYVDKTSLGDLDVQFTDLSTLLRDSDIVSLHAPLTPSTHHIINAETLALMKDGAVLVNTARGGLVDTKALVEALKKGKLRYAALDVVEGDYVDSSHPLMQFRNVLITPHIGAYTRESMASIDECVAESIEAVARGDVPKYVVNREVYDKGPRYLKKT